MFFCIIVVGRSVVFFYVISFSGYDRGFYIASNVFCDNFVKKSQFKDAHIKSEI